MKDSRKLKRSLFLSHRYTVAILVWTSVIIGSFTWNVMNENQQIHELAKKEAQSNCNKDQALLLWIASHGGVYVRADERTSPNPYLSHVPDRDIKISSGESFTLTDATYIINQMTKDYPELCSIEGRVISLKALNPGNRPDDWELSALKAFEKGEREVSEITNYKEKSYLRLIRPIITEKACLKCHAIQGYKEANVQGGISVSVPMGSYLSLEHRARITMIFTHGAVWLMGLVAIGLVSRIEINGTGEWSRH